MKGLFFFRCDWMILMGFLSKKEQTFSTVHGSFDFLIFSLENIRAKLNFFCPKKMGACLNVLKSLFFLIPFFEVLLGHTFSPLFYFGDRWCLNDNGWQKRLSVVYFSPTTPHDFSPIAEQQQKKNPRENHTQFIWQSKSTSFLQQMYKYLKKE